MSAVRLIKWLVFPLPKKDRAAELVGLIGGPDQVLARSRDALGGGEFT